MNNIFQSYSFSDPFIKYVTFFDIGLLLKGEDVSTDTGQSTWSFADSSGGSCPPERSSKETGCLEAVQAAATEAGLGEVFRFKVVDDAYIPPGGFVQHRQPGCFVQS